jgi:hypothetical protein
LNPCRPVRLRRRVEGAADLLRLRQVDAQAALRQRADVQGLVLRQAEARLRLR